MSYHQFQTNNTIPDSIKDSYAKFRKDYPDPKKVAFVMMQYGKTKIHEEITSTIKRTLQEYGITGLRADEYDYHDDLYPNILTYIYGCGFGIAVFERLEDEIFNPNVSFEVGYMFGIRKRVCLLKDETLPKLQTDLVAKLYKPFDVQDPRDTIKSQLTKWMEERGFIRPKGKASPVNRISVKRTIQYGEGGLEWNDHELRFMKRLNRHEIEIDFKESSATAELDQLRISFVFGSIHGGGYGYNSPGEKLLQELLESGRLATATGESWLIPDPILNVRGEWTVRGELLVQEYPELSAFKWLGHDFKARLERAYSPDADEEQRSIKVYFCLKQPLNIS